jgi:predicted permease
LGGSRSADAERELAEEIEAHLAMRAEDLVRAGRTPEEARREAERRFGDVVEARRRLGESARGRSARLARGAWLDGVRRDVRQGMRQAWRLRGFSVLSVLTFALGIGLTTAMYTIVDRVLLRALPYPDADRLVLLQSVDSLGAAYPVVSMGNWVDWQERSRLLQASALWSYRAVTVVQAGDAFRAAGAAVAGPFFAVLRSPLVLGRPFRVDEMQSGAAVAVVSERFWRGRMGGSATLGVVQLADRAVEVVGVIAAGHEFPAGTDIWLGWPSRVERGGMRNNVNWSAVGRLRPGITIEAAQSELSAIARGIHAADPAALYSYGVSVVPLQQMVVGDASGSLLLLIGGVFFVLLVACANLAGLGLARASTRTTEISLRMALGAGRARVLQQLVTEVLVLAVVGGMVGIAFAAWATRLIVLRFGSRLPRAAEISLDGRVLLVALALTLLAGVLAAAAPALRASSVSLRAPLGSERSTVRGGRGLPGAVLVASEIALALLLLTGGGLLIRSFRAVVGRDLGYNAADVLTADIALSSPRFRSDSLARPAYWEALLERARRLSGVRAAAVVNAIPGTGAPGTFVEIEGNADARIGAGYRVVSDDYLATMGIALLAGRAFAATDFRGSERVALVNHRFAEQNWPGRNPLGRLVRAVSQEGILPGGAPWLRVVGVVDDIRHWGYETETEPELYVSYRQVPSHTSSMTLVVRTDTRGGSRLAEAMRAELRALDPTVVAELGLLSARVDGLLFVRRLTMAVLTAFALLALGLAAIGVYGLTSFAVAQRTREMGVRAALGATRTGLLGLMLRSALGVVGTGALAGLLASFALTRVMVNMLFGVRPLDPLTSTAALLLLLSAAVLAALLPSWRAARTDPLVALRQTVQ